MANNFNQSNRISSPHPMFGVRPGWNISDLTPSYEATGTVVLTSITANTISTVQNPQARYITVNVAFTDPTTTCNVDLYQNVSGTNTLALSVPGVNYDNAEVHFGNYEFINMQGGAFAIGISGMSNNSPLTVSYRVTG